MTTQVAAVVTQPGRPTGRKRIIKPSPVEVLAREGGFPEELLLTPESAKDEVMAPVVYQW
jgi:methionyl-tRNA formyltransferase